MMPDQNNKFLRLLPRGRITTSSLIEKFSLKSMIGMIPDLVLPTKILSRGIKEAMI